MMGTFNFFNGSEWVAAGPGLIAVHYVEKKDASTFTSVAAGGNVAVTGLQLADIAVSDASHRLIITAWLGSAAHSLQTARHGMGVNDGSGFLTVGNAEGDRLRTSIGGSTSGVNNDQMVTMPHITIVHTPGVTTPKTYTVHLFNNSSSTRTMWVNRTELDSDNVGTMRTASALMIEEVRV